MPEPVVGDVVWINCRASEPCEGHESKIIRIAKTPVLPGVFTTTIVYRCQKCNRVFSISL